jgi:hypothetical protein
MLTDEQVDEIESGWGNQSVDFLVRDHRILKSMLAASKQDYEDMRAAWQEDEKKIAELTAEQEKAWTALGKIAEYLEHSVTADDWELEPDIKNWLAECLEAKREIEADDRRSLDLFDA